MLHATTLELPLVCKAQQPVILRELRRKWVEWARLFQDVEGGLIEFRHAARAADLRLLELSACAYRDLEHGARFTGFVKYRSGIVESADAPHLAAPGIEIRRQLGGAGVRAHPKLVALRPAQPGRAVFVFRCRSIARLIFHEKRPLPGLVCVTRSREIPHLCAPRSRGQQLIAGAALCAFLSGESFTAEHTCPPRNGGLGRAVTGCHRFLSVT